MKALSVRQPWASLIAEGKKSLELRSRRVHYRGELLICASAAYSKTPDACAVLDPLFLKGEALHKRFPLGVALAVVEVIDCYPFAREHEGRACCPWRKGDAPLFAWELRVSRLVRRFPVKGSLSFFDVADELVARAA